MFIEASSTESNEVRDHLIRDACQSETFRAHRSQSTCRHVIKSASVVRDLGVLLDSELAMREHIGKLT